MTFIDEAAKIAERSTIRTHKTGAVIVGGRRYDTILTNGWSHTPHYELSDGKRSMHAEIHALGRGRHFNLKGAVCHIATISGKSGNRVSARPCLDCAIALKAAGIVTVHFTITKTKTALIHLHDDRWFKNLKVYPQS